MRGTGGPPRCSTPPEGSKLPSGAQAMRRIVAFGVWLALAAPFLPSAALAGGVRPLAPRPLNAVGAAPMHGGILTPLPGPKSAFGSPGGYPLPLPGSPEVRLAPAPVARVPHRGPRRVGSRFPVTTVVYTPTALYDPVAFYQPPGRAAGQRQRVTGRLRLAHRLCHAGRSGAADSRGHGARRAVGRRVSDRTLRAARRWERDALRVGVDSESTAGAAGRRAARGRAGGHPWRPRRRGAPCTAGPTTRAP